MRKKDFKIIAFTAGALVIVALLRACAVTPYLIPSSGMENTLFRGEGILVNKWSYGLRLPLMKWMGYRRCADSPVQREDIIVFNNPGNLTEPFIDRRELYIGRCVGVPGDTLLVDSLFSTVLTKQKTPDQKFLYAYPRKKEKLIDSLLTLLSIPSDKLMGQDSVKNIRSFSRYDLYLLEQALNGRCKIEPINKGAPAGQLRPLIVPGKGKVVRVQAWNRTLLQNTLVLHEHKQAEVRNDTLFVEGKPVQHCYFTQDYYWVASNNSINLSDSRLFGWVPKSHIIGKATSIWFSKEKEEGLFQGYRWNRIGRKVK